MWEDADYLATEGLCDLAGRVTSFSPHSLWLLHVKRWEETNDLRIRLKVSGDHACFTRPEMKVERVSL